MIDTHAHLSIEMNTKSASYGKRNFIVEKNRFGATSSQYVIEMTDKGLSLFVKKAENNNEDFVPNVGRGRRRLRVA